MQGTPVACSPGTEPNSWEFLVRMAIPVYLYSPTHAASPAGQRAFIYLMQPCPQALRHLGPQKNKLWLAKADPNFIGYTYKNWEAVQPSDGGERK
eukprot:scaffold295055_cov15-Tisochrysis_lutea.AAC.1